MGDVSVNKVLVQAWGPEKTRSVAHACNPGAREAEGEDLWVSLDESGSFRLSERHGFE